MNADLSALDGAFDATVDDASAAQYGVLDATLDGAPAALDSGFATEQYVDAYAPQLVGSTDSTTEVVASAVPAEGSATVDQNVDVWPLLTRTFAAATPPVRPPAAATKVQPPMITRVRFPAVRRARAPAAML